MNKLCPRCEANIMRPIEVENALSRRDNKTYICNGCGQEEAMFDFKIKIMHNNFFAKIKEMQDKESAWLKEVDNGTTC